MKLWQNKLKQNLHPHHLNEAILFELSDKIIKLIDREKIMPTVHSTMQTPSVFRAHYVTRYILCQKILSYFSNSI